MGFPLHGFMAANLPGHCFRVPSTPLHAALFGAEPAFLNHGSRDARAQKPCMALMMRNPEGSAIPPGTFREREHDEIRRNL